MSQPPPILVLAVSALALPAAIAHASDFVIDPVHTQVYACASHVGFSEPCARFRVKSGTFTFDDDNWSTSKLDVAVDTASADLGDAKWNAIVRSWQFLDAGKFPELRFVSRAVEKTGARTGIVHGTLTLRGDSRALDLAVTFNRAGLDPYDFRYTAGFAATATLKRSDFGITKYLPDIGDEVQIRVEVEGLRGKPASVQTGRQPTEP
ncbi:MAG: polyisoprenoid-binding protein [Proteobacteria bacterium]|nr:polyisoprenoid-binding protein [Pseudomonadota bacterium]